jgi:HD-like signal output (HDOD) protein
VTLTAERQSLRTRALESLGQLPPFSPILNRLLASLAREDVSFVRIADLIEKDTVLAGNVLRLVNSALYGRRATVNSVRHAVSLLGINKLRNATLGMSVTRMWNQVRTPSGWSMGKFNLHSVGTAMLADVLSQAGDVDYAEGAFAAGLFHDLGRLLIAIGLPEEHDQITRLSSGGFSRYECEREVLGFTHAELSGDAMSVWNLPEEIRTAVTYHHDPELAPETEAPISLSSLVAAADEFINAFGYTIETTSRISSTEHATKRLESLGLNQPLPDLLETFSTDFEAMRAMF